mmetsp:Transcript_7019/g.14382  ORF Transcript_7019/g.14382 Transcript_7019/m.14382 type:complete len:252 (-) Transcript_7019:436-1191(-)
MENVRKACAAVRKCMVVAATDPPRTLRWASTISGLLLILGGVAGVFTINPLSAIISVYNVFFGLLIVLTELKNYPIIRTFQKSVDVYFHLLSVPRGKGGFYCFIGFLAFFSSEKFDISRVCVLIVSIVGVIHLCACKRCGAVGDEEAGSSTLSPHNPQEMAVVESGTVGGPGDSTGWASLMKQVVADSPEVLPGMLSLAGGAAGAVNAVCGKSSGGGDGGSGSGGCGEVGGECGGSSGMSGGGGAATTMHG